MAMNPTERNKAIVRSQAQAINSRDIELLAQTTSAHLIRHCQATPGVEIRSLGQFQDFLRSDWANCPDSVIAIQQMVAEGDRVAVFGTYEATQAGPFGPYPGTGKRFCVDFAGIFRIENDKVAEIWVTWDNLAALTQLGHFQPAG